MARAIIVKQIARRPKHQTRGIDRPTRQTGRVMLETGDVPSKVAQRVLTQVKNATRKDGNDRQIEYVNIITVAGGRHNINSRVLYRVYRSQSDGRVYVYGGTSKRKERMGKPAGSVEAKLVSVD